jgi:hypothetical protein
MIAANHSHVSNRNLKNFKKGLTVVFKNLDYLHKLKT